MGRIRQLDTVTANGIAAGEVVERPSSVVKELVENAIDAGASSINIDIYDGGISLIRVSDDGCGMDEEDAILAFSLHATSKIEKLDDLFALHTMGFRGEALSSISAAARVSIKTKQHGEEKGTEVSIDGGEIVHVTSVGCKAGTTIEIRDLFYNLPARYKFLKKNQTEAQYIIILCERFSLIRPDISFRLTNQGKEVLHTPGNNEMLSSLYCIYGKKLIDECILIDETFGEISISGYVGKPNIARSNRGEQTIFVNDRLIRSKTISSAIDEAYKTLLMKGRYAFLILSLRIPSSYVDVNVHPQKAEVRFWNDNAVFTAVYHIINQALLSVSHVIIPKTEALFTSETNSTQSTFVSSSDGSIEINDEKAVLHPVDTFSKHIPIASEQVLTFSEDHVNVTKSNEGETSYASAHTSEDVAPSPYAGFTIHDLLDARFIGVLFSTYILLERKDTLLMLDQHAAHEKILFEQLRNRARDNNTEICSSQILLLPQIITLSASDMHFVMTKQGILNSSGFVFETMGEKEIILREIPAVSIEMNPTEAFLCALDELKRELPKTDEQMLLAITTAACKAAVKGHDRLDEIEVMALIDDLTKLRNPYHCPHGRPIIILLSQKDLEKEFKRIV